MISMETARWRLMRCEAAAGDFNMALDEAILESVGAGHSLPTLRLYRWSPPCLSLGHAQPVSDVDKDALRLRGWGLVRRPTGGRAILHTDELTYSVIAPLREPRVYGNILESYQRLSGALLNAMHRLGIPAVADHEYTQAQLVSASAPVCFERPSNYEITVDEKKLIGSAQARRREGVLQHGSLPLTGDLTRITQGLAYADEHERATAAARLLEHAQTVEMICGREISWDAAAEAFALGFQETLAIEFEEGQPTALELERARELVQQKYGSPEWTERI